MMGSEKGDELRQRETGLSEHRAERVGRKCPMHRHNDRPAVASELHMAARWLTCTNPALARAAMTSAPPTTGSPGLTPGVRRWR